MSERPLKENPKLFDKIVLHFGGITKMAIAIKCSIQAIQYAKTRGYFSINQAAKIVALTNGKFNIENLVKNDDLYILENLRKDLGD